ncbi:MarR family transcriptional regulator [Neisseriaceae bacterium TC5R-5]|nr:MarR family transcriptional regulator [Neisseriaceae bacterium TC5R-5]
MLDLSTQENRRATMAAFFHAYQAFTGKSDEILAKRGLARVHHRILFFVASQPGLAVKDLLAAMGVSKQAINIPLRQLLEMGLIDSVTASHDKRVKQLSLSSSGLALEMLLYREQTRLLQQAFIAVGEEATQGWVQVNAELSKACAG